MQQSKAPPSSMLPHSFKTLKSPQTISQTRDSMASDSDVGVELEEEGHYAPNDHKLYGSLRKGGAVPLFSRECAGLCAATFSSVFAYTALQSVARPLLATLLQLTTQEQLAVQRLVELPMALSFVIGLLSDSRPIYGRRRKSYMVMGLVINGVATLLLGMMAMHFESLHATADRNNLLVTLAILLTAVASFGCMFTYLSVQTRTVELAQQEPLVARGSIVASYLVLRRVTSLLCGVFTYAVLGTDRSAKPHLALSTSLFLIVVIVCVAPLPLIVAFWTEEFYSLPVSFKARSQIFWKIMQQKAVWRTMAFIACFSLFLGIKFSDTASVVVTWAGAAKDNSLLLRMISDVTMVIVLTVWRYAFMNRLWRRFFLWAPVFQIVPAFVISAIVAYGVSRNRYLYRSVISLTAIGGGISQLTNIVPLIEIVQEGSEGATVGLVLSLQRLISIFVSTNSHGLFSAQNFYDPFQIVQRDDAHAHGVVFKTLVINYAINALSVLGLLLLPSQKLDAQQMRSYGGFTKVAATGMVGFALVLFSFSMVVNVMTFIPATACARIVGGAGCK